MSRAAIRVNAETQARVGRRDITETDLVNQVFSLDEPKIEGSVTRPTRPVDWAAGAGTSVDGSIMVSSARAFTERRRDGQASVIWVTQR